MSGTARGDGFKATQLTGKQRINLGGFPGGPTTRTEVVKAVTGFADTVAKDVFTVTVPNSTQAAMIDVEVLGVMGAGGAVGAGETVRISKYQVAVVRRAGLAAVVAVSSAIGGATAAVAGASALTSVVVSASSVSGANGVTQTFTIKVAITKTAGSADNHTAVARATLLNQNATGITIQ